MYIKNPNDIVDTLVSDYKGIFGETLIGVVMYGSALSHEFIPGKSEINLIIILKDISIGTIRSCMEIQNKWLKRGVAIPQFMTVPYVMSSLDSFPVEFLNIQSEYRVLFGDDVLKECNINKQYLRLQCERKLKDIGTDLRTEFLKTNGNKKGLRVVLSRSVKQLIPLFRAILILHDRKLPNSQSEVVAAVEDLFGLGSSALSDILLNKRDIVDFQKFYDEFAKTIDLMIQYIDNMSDPIVCNRDLSNI